MIEITPPTAEQFPSYFGRYIDLAKNGSVLAGLSDDRQITLDLVNSISPEKSLFRYAPGKWSIREILGHITDTERVFVSRALRIARGDQSALPGFDQDDFTSAAFFDECDWNDLIEDFDLLRRSTVSMFKSLPPHSLDHLGSVDGQAMAARCIPFILLGHTRHHVKVLQSCYGI